MRGAPFIAVSDRPHREARLPAPVVGRVPSHHARKPQYLLIFLPATPQNHRSPPR